MKKYLIGFILNFFNNGVSFFALIDNKSNVHKRARIYRGVQIYQSFIGRYSYVSKGSSLVCARVGSFCSIAENVKIGLANHTISLLSTSPIFTEKINSTRYSWVSATEISPFQQVTIGNDVWIGSGVTVLGGIEIGDGAVIGASAVVTKNVPPYAIVAGVPARIIRYRFEPEVIEKLLSVKWWNWPEDRLKEHLEVFQMKNFDNFLNKNL